MRNIFAILLPTTLPRAISLFHCRLASKLTTSSGIEVPKATIVRPITRLEIPSFFASDEAPRTRISAHPIRIMSQNIRERMGISIVRL